ncbi:xanthosine triphosphate pyrophosphatase [Marinitoga sp. 1135]|uniref:dITP/XTP pyrophosphatase n=1 Tax=Marinitoga piezophila (strain DSM 14283 / JCM 11233 / KA3) TaxID=443254 RepID=H2J6V6_MARPK|nr:MULTISPECIES: RdgB/HAM1 family non-canonical purine NTP pyrophosphatase [Marinitoga]AEX85221.1 non-canonical purine NTP pyrophosphatase, rdgB/HAM1 family [Marinitoga piezophila KA3]APT75711.1 xanthosine triphosphate pyrophosphatase [Marinitoga sp. 1137]NUU95450.1 xanthosine triphosphate pyrophosphatase [Marinitoga sp. 1135]NUU97377.1 xanthosine triphosphate pyrophosphatase [Marinitoga sp. 1138]
MTIYLATGNKHKVKEINEIKPKNIELRGIFEIIKGFSVNEDGKTFIENSIKKAIEAATLLRMPVIADDSGLEIDILNGFPGIYSARFMEGKSYNEKMKYILKKLNNVPYERRTARFVCVATYYDPKKNLLFSVEGEVKGKIGYSISGKEGFGYDPIFIPDGYTISFGELGQEVKNKISHRKRAFEKLFRILNNITTIEKNS